MDDDYIPLLRGKMELAKQELERVSKKRLELAEQEHALIEEVQGYEKVIAGALRRNGKPVPKSLVPDKSADQIKVVPTQSAVEFIEGQIRIRDPHGCTIREIRKVLAESGYKIHPNYPYHVVAKLKRSGKVKEVDGKLVWIPR